MDKGIILEVKDLKVVFHRENEITTAVEGVNFWLEQGETLGIVGESGSGKSVTALSLMGLIPYPEGKIVTGSIVFRDTENLELSLISLSRKTVAKYQG